MNKWLMDKVITYVIVPIILIVGLIFFTLIYLPYVGIRRRLDPVFDKKYR